MNLRAFLVSTLFLMPLPAFSQQSTVYSECYRNVEEYIPGYYTGEGRYVSGYVRTNRQSVPCSTSQAGPQLSRAQCRSRTQFNGILGGALAAAFSKRDAYIWSIPLGVALGVTSAKLDCPY